MPPAVAKRLEFVAEINEDPSEEEEPMEEDVEEPLEDEVLPEESDEVLMWEEPPPTPEIVELSDDSEDEDLEVLAAIEAEWDDFLALLPQVKVEADPDEILEVDDSTDEMEEESDEEDDFDDDSRSDPDLNLL